MPFYLIFWEIWFFLWCYSCLYKCHLLDDVITSLALLIRNILTNVYENLLNIKYQNEISKKKKWNIKKKKWILLKGYISVFSLLLKFRFNRIVNNFIWSYVYLFKIIFTFTLHFAIKVKTLLRRLGNPIPVYWCNK